MWTFRLIGYVKNRSTLHKNEIVPIFDSLLINVYIRSKIIKNGLHHLISILLLEYRLKRKAENDNIIVTLIGNRGAYIILRISQNSR